MMLYERILDWEGKIDITHYINFSNNKYEFDWASKCI